MRYLHPVQMHEQFVASGEYAVLARGTATQITELWSIHQLPDGAWFVRVDSDWLTEQGTLILAEALLTPGDGGGMTLDRIDRRRYQYRSGQPMTEQRENYTFLDAYAQVGYSTPGGEREYAEQPFDRAYLPALAWPHAHILTGFSVRALLAQGAPTPALVGFDALSGSFRTATLAAQVVAHEPIMVGMRAVDAARCALTQDGVPLATVWLDAHGLLLRREDSAQVVSLMQYLHRLEAKPIS